MAVESELVFLTGATGFLGYLTLIQLLQAGHHVRAAVRSQSKIAKIKSAPSFKALASKGSSVEWVVVPDMTAPGAYDEVVKGVTSIIHIASPIPTFGAEPIPEAKLDEYFVQQPRQATLGLLEAAQKAGTVKRIVKTSSIVAIVPFEYYLGQGADYTRDFDANTRIPVAKGPFPFGEFQAYSAGKAGALNAAEEWIESHQPSFDLVTIFPGWIFGRDELVTDVETLRTGSTNAVLLGLILGNQTDQPGNSSVVYGEDAARMHVMALNSSKVNGGESFIAATEFQWNETPEILKRSFPKEVAEGKLSDNGQQPTLIIKHPSEKSEEVFGFKFTPFKNIVESVAQQYLDLLSKA
ncbi:uncharacterized protein B0I36DRAFT_296096 [Microdochium trichocladiopsis]|uniref:NAD-dependent epimerase/dehydratase domain-containing protein n=1 Tax=Microdochium trichocladiopsis TaxID=1682393 RepID=A0A9P8XY84_9PEZI|nr:uncharacterized protein B0I36DRAFT_296096 [Microdochium trichocladiopsis]KAH7020709.1 hypothetical protein B0I36DRAFT_296096 [Microdochium trichocladiopsis]